jgi:hypothetical protein
MFDPRILSGSPLFFNKYTISIGRLCKLMSTSDINLIKRVNIPLPKFILKRQTAKLLEVVDLITGCRLTEFSDLVIACEIILDRTLDRNMTFFEFWKYYKEAVKKTSQELETIGKN